jgi:hypothetical protein
MRRDDRSPDAYRALVGGVQRELLDAVREVILEVVPDVEEGIGHGMLDYPGLANLAAQKHHVSLYLMPDVLERHRSAFPGTSCGRSCLRFTKSEQLDRDALRALLADVWETRRATR